MNKPALLLLGFVFSINSSCAQEHGKDMNKDQVTHLYTNELIHESSPYLLQHAHNPVNWYPWGNKALKKAKDENKMLIISVGYAACHWCHVMEHESFEDPEVAALMNEHFVCIKVDREERPDVDQIYMDAANLMTGRGGWPLNALALANGQPYYAGTYFPKAKWMEVLRYFAEVKKTKPEALIAQAQKVTEGINSLENVPLKNEEALFEIEDLEKSFNAWKPGIDMVRGGGDRAPKFPMPCIWEYIMQYGYLTRDETAQRALKVTLDNMAYGGIYDHLGGGFARYSTDADWHVPHFEKMLYDNGQLVSLYTHAWQATHNPVYKDVVFETLDFVEREMTSKEGGFYSSLDADSEGEEGKFYVWTKDEIDAALSSDAPLFSDYYDVTPKGNWEHGKNILRRTEPDSSFLERKGIDKMELNRLLTEAKSKLMAIRDERIRPGLDDKILTSWNGLMLKGYADAYMTFGEKHFLKAALKNANFLVDKVMDDEGGLARNYKNGKSSIPAFLDDYAFVISAFTTLYQATFDESWLEKASLLNAYAIEHFFDKTSGMFFYTHNDHSNLIARKKELSDNVIPASNSEMAKNLFVLGHYYNNESHIEMAKQMLVNMKDEVHRNLYFYANWSILEAHLVSEPYEIAVLGNDAIEKRHEFSQYYLPNALFLGGKKEGSLALLKDKLVKGQTTIYVCQNKTCRLPVTDVKDALPQIMIDN